MKGKVLIIIAICFVLTINVFAQPKGTPKVVKKTNGVDNNQPIIVRFQPNDEILLNGEKIAFVRLGDEITRRIAAKNPDEEIVFVAGDKDVAFQRVINILKLGRKADSDNFGLIIFNEAEDIDISKAVKVKIVLEEFNGKIKPSSLFLRAALDNNGKITLNSKPQTPESLETELRRIFEQRKKKKIYISGGDEIDATVFIKATLSTQYGNVLNLIKIVENAGAYPIAIEIDKLTR